MNEKYLMVQKFWENITNGCTPRGQNRPPMGSLWYPFTSSFSIFWCGSIMFFHATLSHHFGSSSDQIRSMCIALSCVYEWMQVRVKERSTDREKGRKWKGWIRAHALWKTKIQLYLQLSNSNSLQLHLSVRYENIKTNIKQLYEIRFVCYITF